jgi:hypothetical protein
MALDKKEYEPMKVYLCGGINGLTDAQAKDWREEAKALLRYETLDPMRHDYRGREDENVGYIVAGDENDIRESDCVLVWAERASWGTAMEVYAAKRTFSKLVVTVVPPGVPVSPWLRFHSHHICTSLADACAWINGYVALVEYRSEGR